MCDGQRLDSAAIVGRIDQLTEELIALRGELHGCRSDLGDLARVAGETRTIAGTHLDHIPELRAQLLAARRTPEYRAALVEEEPLITVRIATYDRPDPLFGRTLPSVLAQTHTRLEVIIVGDGCGEETARRARSVADPRVSFVNMPHRGIYPSDPYHRWMVAGAPAMNLGDQLATGAWIAPLDDDDEFTPDHVEALVRRARAESFEMVYGRMRVLSATPGEEKELGVHPPQLGEFGFQAAIYLSSLRFFEHDAAAWVLNEPSDWNMCRRMLASGVRIGYLPQVVTTLHPAGPDQAPDQG